MLKRRLDYWLPGYAAGLPRRLAGARERRDRLTHVFFLICDHYEPRHKATRPGQPEERVATWAREYPKFQDRCRAAFGAAPLHSWFYPPHHGDIHLPALARMAHAGGGEVELHYHHQGDTADKLRRDLLATLDLYNRWGLLLESGRPPRRSFGFVHGDWALDNSGLHGENCGVNGELSLLQGLGCWADFTMPSANECQTHKINSIYYAKDDPSRSKSHDRGVDARVGVRDPEGFLLIQGPLALNMGAPGHPRIENASLTSANWGRPDRIHKWIDCQVHVEGRPEWLFVKLHTHGAIEGDFDALFGDKAFAMHRVLNERYNDGTRYKLHYVTARQAYNLVKAAEQGVPSADPAAYFDHVIPKPATHHYCLDTPHRLQACTPLSLVIDDIESAAVPATLRTRLGALESIGARLRALDVDATASRATLGLHGMGDAVELRFRQPVELQCQTLPAAALSSNADRTAWTVGAAPAASLNLHWQPL